MSGALWDTIWSSDQLGTVGDWKPSSLVGGTDGGLQNVDEFSTAVILALFTDGELPEEMIDDVTFSVYDRHQWHGNLFDIDYGEEQFGSLLWTLRRTILTDEIARLAEHFAAQALQPLVRQGRCGGVQVQATIDKDNNQLTLHILCWGVGSEEQDRVFTADLFALQ
jgi:phage gp46-like protein